MDQRWMLRLPEVEAVFVLSISWSMLSRKKLAHSTRSILRVFEVPRFCVIDLLASVELRPGIAVFAYTVSVPCIASLL